jgi:hypothetical protein
MQGILLLRIFDGNENPFDLDTARPLTASVNGLRKKLFPDGGRWKDLIKSKAIS